jgi:hypothetical protein
MRRIAPVIALLVCIGSVGALLMAYKANVARRGPWDAWQPPAIALPSPNGFDTYLKAFALKDEIDHAHSLPEPVPDYVTAADIARWRKDPWGAGPRDLPLAQRVGLYADVLKLAREAFRQECRVPPPGTAEAAHYLSCFRAVAILLEMESACYRERGDFADAADSAIDCMRMAQDVATERSTISVVSTNAAEARGRRSLDEALPHLDAARCKAAVARLEAIEQRRVPMTEVIDGEERLTRVLFKDVVAGPDTLTLDMVSDALKDLNGGKPVDIRRIDYRKSWQTLGDNYAQLRETAARPYAEQQKLARSPDPLVAYLTAGFRIGAWFYDADSKAQSRLRIVQLGARAYLLERGHLPSGLAYLVPGYVPAAPSDPFGTGPLKSKLQGDTLLIYSIGPDGVDDGGKAIEGVIREESKGDIVVEVNAKG